MKEMKVSAVVGLSVTLLAVVTAISFSFATVTYQKEVVSLKKINAEYRQVIEDYKTVLLSIKNSLAKVDIQAP
jgi:hypothetical protein